MFSWHLLVLAAVLLVLLAVVVGVIVAVVVSVRRSNAARDERIAQRTAELLRSQR